MTPSKIKMWGYWRGAEEVIRRCMAARQHIPTQNEIDIIAELAGRHKGDASSSKALKEFMRPFGITAQKISEDVTIVHWAGDPNVKEILNASLSELPEFLSSEDSEIRLLARWRLGALT